MEHFYNDDAERRFDAENSAKCGDYDNPNEGCPNCGRHRVMLGGDGKHRCEKCCWCIEDGACDEALRAYLS